mgnify:CR=1 FL=1
MLIGAIIGATFAAWYDNRPGGVVPTSEVISDIVALAGTGALLGWLVNLAV